tara:strand:- start:4635 stop:6947 length:2313 start_codon:yes stop_codon:yes gene_type:complete
MLFNTKAQTLSSLKIKGAIIPKIFYFKKIDFKKNPEKYLKIIRKRFLDKVAIRSSSANEDQENNSLAGYFDSFLNINSNKINDLKNSIEKVIKSYDRKSNKNDEILIQEMVYDVKFSGVITTNDKVTGAPYIQINYSTGNKTDTVTSGGGGSKSFIFYKYSKYRPQENFINNLIDLSLRIEKKINKEFLDIEFAIDKNYKIYILQLRRLSNRKSSLNISSCNQMLLRIEKKIDKLKVKHYDLLGKTTAFGVMPDWNPAEIIGNKPKNLALSLYQDLITNKIWSVQRFNYGFRNVLSNHLMTIFLGSPYVDLRVDFNSWLPKKLDNKISEKLINYYLSTFIKNKNLHDKVEFEILFTCHTPQTKSKLKDKLKNILNIKEINELELCLKDINRKTFENYFIDKLKILTLQEKQIKLKKSKMYYIDKIYWLVEDCKNLGTLPFAGLARSAFVSKEILLSLVKTGVISGHQYEIFLENIATISSEMKKDIYIKTRKNFIKKYGHIRPNTYEITTKNYKDNFDKYFNIKKKLQSSEKKRRVNFTNNQKKQIKQYLKNNNFNFTINKFLTFLSESIALREYSKFIFTKNIDAIFNYLKIFLKRYKIKENDISFLDINTIKDFYYNLSNHNIKDTLLSEINTNKKNYLENIQLKLPEVITSKKDIYFYFERYNKINFVGSKNITSNILEIKKIKNKNQIKSKIILIENADPGYDYLFTYNIAGLITKFGGANSHMSIRCSELGIPAAIGVGEKKYNEIINTKKIMIDCLNEKIHLIS